VRPTIGLAILALARGAAPYGVPTADDIERRFWREVEKLFRREYSDERACAEWIDLGGEG
jgi:hypothetical protein